MWYPKVTPEPLEFGVAFHKAMEYMYAPENWHDKFTAKNLAIVAFRRETERQLKDFIRLNGEPEADVLQNRRDRIELGINMIRYYAEDVASIEDRNFTPLMVEVGFEVPIEDHNTGEQLWCTCNQCYARFESQKVVSNMWRGLPVTYGGRIDMIAKDQIGRVWCYDWKTTSRILDEDAESSFLQLDDQITCVPMNTEALTPTGWKRRSELEVGELVLAYDQKSKSNKWTPILAFHDFDNAELFQLSDKTKSFCAITTANHRWMGERPSSHGKYAKIIDWEPDTQKIDEYNSKAAIYVSANSEVDGSLPITPDEAALIAWIITDGSLTIRGNSYQAAIAQANHKYANEIQALIDRIGIKHSVREYPGSNLSNRPYFKWYLSQPYISDLWDRAGIMGRHGNLDEFVLGLSAKSRTSFVEAGMKAEGSLRKNGSGTFCQNDGEVKEAFRLAMFLEGRRLSIGGPKYFGVRVGRPVADVRTLNTTKVEGKHRVWCISTKYNSWVMRQGKQITITGNSYCWALWQLGYDIAGFVYVEIKKTYPKPPERLSRPYKGRLFSTNKQHLTDYRNFVDTVAVQDGQGFQTGLYDEYIDWLKTEGPRFTQRHEIARNHHELVNAGRNIALEAMDMTQNPRIYPQPGRFSCPTCLFRQPCLGMNMNEDVQYLLDTLFEKRTHHYWEDKPVSTD